MSRKPQACPWCNGQAGVRETAYRETARWYQVWYQVECFQCAAQGPEDSDRGAVRAWNRITLRDEESQP